MEEKDKINQLIRYDDEHKLRLIGRTKQFDTEEHRNLDNEIGKQTLSTEDNGDNGSDSVPICGVNSYHGRLNYTTTTQGDRALATRLNQESQMCVPFVSEYSDCNDDNLCSGCSKCTCTSEGEWSCRDVRECPQYSPEDALQEFGVNRINGEFDPNTNDAEGIFDSALDMLEYGGKRPTSRVREGWSYTTYIAPSLLHCSVIDHSDTITKAPDAKRSAPPMDTCNTRGVTELHGFFMKHELVNEQTNHLMVSNRRRPWTVKTPEALQVQMSKKNKKTVKTSSNPQVPAPQPQQDNDQLLDQLHSMTLNDFVDSLSRSKRSVSIAKGHKKRSVDKEMEKYNHNGNLSHTSNNSIHFYNTIDELNEGIVHQANNPINV
uniref:SFRICE_008761 n=1 Tax=Spodoptera frugiperda TaxID=7108 RepID=A0A2H1V447_SPOFR